MPPILVKIGFWLFVSAVIGGTCFVSNQLGYTKGVADTRAAQQAADIAALNQSITQFNEAAKAAGDLNLQLSKTISDRQKADQHTTQVFSDALKKTAQLRFNCVFDSNIMQQLSEAADRADQAASSGFGSALSTGDPPTF